MTLIKWKPRENVLRTDDELGRFFQDFFQPLDLFRPENGHSLHPATNVTETKDAYELSVELPGIEKKKIAVNLEDGVLNISVANEEEAKEKEEDYYHAERRYGSFSRSFRLPEEVLPEKIKASHKDGVLKVTIPKPPEVEKKIVKIEVK